MTRKTVVVASDGSTHTYPEGFNAFMDRQFPDWLLVKDEEKVTQALFFRPRYTLKRDFKEGE
jgi:hypothetical protein